MCEELSPAPAPRIWCPCCLARCDGCGASVCRSHAKARPIGAETDRRLCLDCDTREYADFMLTRAQAWPAVYGECFHSIY